MKKFFPLSNERYIFHNYRVYHPVLCVYDAGITYPDEEYRIKEKPMDCNLFEYIVSGKGYITFGGKTHTLTSGDVVFVGKDTVVRYGSNRKDPYTKLWFTTDGELTPKLLEAFNVKNGAYIFRKNLYPYFEKFFHTLETEEFDIEKAAKHVVGIMMHLFVLNDENDSKEMTAAEQIKMYIDTMWQSGIGISDIAKRFNISERTCTRHFTKAYGETPCNYIKNCRLEAAASLVCGTDYTVTEIASMLGYCDQSYLSTEFKKKYGVYPTVYKKQIHTENPEFPWHNINKER